MTFKDLKIIDPILTAIENEGYETPSPIQLEAIPLLLDGHDLLASAQTGTGKTAAFAIPIIQNIIKDKENDTDPGKRILRALILAPTRELAEQIKQSFKTYAGTLNIKVGAIYGGASQRAQEVMIKKGLDVLIATPGRLMDLMKQKIVKLDTVQYFVLDEADNLLDMGFIKDVRYIKGFIPRTRQTMMFSATISLEIANLSTELLSMPKQLAMAPPALMLDTIKHSVFYVEKKDKFDLLLDLLTNKELVSVLVFMRTKHTANKLVEQLEDYGVRVDAIHGNKSQNARQKALNDFKDKKIRVLIATDIASRGIDIDELTHVINFDLPDTAETYVHRIGRTGRRGLTGEAYTFCSNAERPLLKAVEKFTNLKLEVLKLEPVNAESKFKKISPAERAEFNRPQELIEKRSEEPKKGRGFRKDNHRSEGGKYVNKKDKNGEVIAEGPANFGPKRNTNRPKQRNFEDRSPREEGRSKRRFSDESRDGKPELNLENQTGKKPYPKRRNFDERTPREEGRSKRGFNAETREKNTDVNIDKQSGRKPYPKRKNFEERTPREEGRGKTRFSNESRAKNPDANLENQTAKKPYPKRKNFEGRPGRDDWKSKKRFNNESHEKGGDEKPANQTGKKPYPKRRNFDGVGARPEGRSEKRFSGERVEHKGEGKPNNNAAKKPYEKRKFAGKKPYSPDGKTTKSRRPYSGKPGASRPRKRNEE